MDSTYNYQYPGWSSGDTCDQPSQRMYINPHFNQPLVAQPMVNHNFYPQNNLNNSVHYHVNPNFYPPSRSSNDSSVAKIHINPKFVNSSKKLTQEKYPIRVNMSEEKNLANLRTDSIIGDEHRNCTPISKSRYSIVRNRVMPTKIESSVSTEPKKSNNCITHKNTVTISKYKSIHINNVKKKLDNSTEILITNNTQKQIDPSTSSSNKYRLVKVNDTSKVAPAQNKSKVKLIKSQSKSWHATSKRKYIKPANEVKYLINKNAILNKFNIKSSKTLKKINTKKINTKGRLKVNNIPCPLFKKYGFCIRKSKGNCEFQHDKKHVAICKKFVKGLCHDPECLLSHELSSNKMPTCHFYLNGMCTKSDCPYLHVKLSADATVCVNFLKGYCENGENCLKRHVSARPRDTDRGKCSRKGSHSSKDKIEKPCKNIKQKVNTEPTEKGQHEEIDRKDLERDNSNADGSNRYYEARTDHSTKLENGDVIKPSRCKLGSLPNFIKL